MPDSLIHLHVPAALKGRWIRASRAAGLRLSDWIIEAVEAHMQQVLAQIVIPDTVEFADLKLARTPDGSVAFDWTPIRRICEASGVDIAMIQASEDNIAGLLARWYSAHRADGGSPDLVAEDLILETRTEDAAGQPWSLPPGRA